MCLEAAYQNGICDDNSRKNRDLQTEPGPFLSGGKLQSRQNNEKGQYGKKKMGNIIEPPHKCIRVHMNFNINGIGKRELIVWVSDRPVDSVPGNKYQKINRCFPEKLLSSKPP